jgi:hypothetical protein
VYTRASWCEPEAPNYFDVLFEDDQVVRSLVFPPPKHTSCTCTTHMTYCRAAVCSCAWQWSSWVLCKLQTATQAWQTSLRPPSPPRGSHICTPIPSGCACSGVCTQLAVCKPAGLQVLPGGGYFCQHTVVWLLQQYHQQHRSSRYPASLVPVPVHRLGRGTSGDGFGRGNP